MKKKIVFNSVIHGNMEALIDFYNKNLSDKFDNKVEIIYIDNYQWINNRLKRYFNRVKQLLCRYDLVISDYPTKLFLRSNNNIFMSHGYGTKRTPGVNEITNKKVMRKFIYLRKKVDYLITLSDRDSTYFLKNNELDKYPLPQYMPLGLPRNDVLLNNNYRDKCKTEIEKKYNIKGSKIILYCPTWRGYKLGGEFPLKRNDFVKLNEYLGENNWKLLYRPHYIEKLFNYSLIKDLNNVLIMDFEKEPETQKILAATDLLITDYSSIYVDYLIMKKPLAFIPFDKDQYDDFRGLAVDFNNEIETPGPKIWNVNELISYLHNLDGGDDKFKECRKVALENFYRYSEGESCCRIWNLIKQILNLS